MGGGAGVGGCLNGSFLQKPRPALWGEKILLLNCCEGFWVKGSALSGRENTDEHHQGNEHTHLRAEKEQTVKHLYCCCSSSFWSSLFSF